MITATASTESVEKRRNDILRKFRSFKQALDGMKFAVAQTLLTTAASRPTICRIVNSEVRIVGKIHAKNDWCACASCGENPMPGNVTVHVPTRSIASLTLEFRSRGKQQWIPRSTPGEDNKRYDPDS